MNMYTTSRKDDLVSLYYLIVYIIDGDLPFLPKIMSKDMKSFMYMKNKKENLTPDDLCYNDKLVGLKQFIT